MAPKKAADVLGFLEKVPLFRELPLDDIKAINDVVQAKTFEPEQVVINQGDQGDEFFLVVDGEAVVSVKENEFRVGDKVRLMKRLIFGGKPVLPDTIGVVDKYDASRDYPLTVCIRETGRRGRVLPNEIELTTGAAPNKIVATLKAGDYFGEQSLLKGQPRNATVAAGEGGKLSLVSLSGQQFKDLKLGEKLKFSKRKAVVTADPAPDRSGRDSGKTDAEKRLVIDGLMNNKRLNEIVDLQESQVERLCDLAWRREVTKGELVVKQRDIVANEMFVIKSGTYEVSIESLEDDGTGHKVPTSVVVGTLKEGMSFGELALLHQAPRAATVTCVSEDGGDLFVLERFDLKDILKRAHEQRQLEFTKIIASIKIFNCILADERVALAEAVTEVTYLKDEKIMKEGETGDAFFILNKGHIVFTKKGKQVHEMDTAASDSCMFFGERALLTHEPRAASVTVASETCSVLVIQKPRFEALLGPLKELIEEHAAGARVSKVTSAEAKPVEMLNIQKSDLTRVGLLGCGGFGTVTLEQHKATGETYALKSMSKGYIAAVQMENSVVREKEIMQMLDCPFITKLVATFRDAEYVHMLMEACLGGEVYATYHKFRWHGDSDRARFYSASVVYAFEYLHQRNIIYRDLKPENLLIDHQGFPKLADMGLAKISVGQTYTCCGTPDYFAPEVVRQSGMGKGVDWWTWGVFMFECMSGHTPFEADDPMQTYQRICRGIQRVKFPVIDHDFIDLVKRCCAQQAVDRLPLRPGGVKNVKDHAFYRGFNWGGMLDKTIEPPYIPTVADSLDLQNFNADETDMAPVVPYTDDGSTWDQAFEMKYSEMKTNGDF